MTLRTRRPTLALLASALTALAVVVGPPAASAATVSAPGGALTFNAAAGETNTAVVTQTGLLAATGGYLVTEQNPGLTLTPGEGCTDTSSLPIPGLPPGVLCGGPLNLTGPISSITMNLGDGNDTGIAGTNGGSPPPATINGEAGDDTLVGDVGPTTFNGGDGTDRVAYVSIDEAEVRDEASGLGVTATLPAPGGAASTGNGAAGEVDTIAGDVEGLIGSNGDDALTGNATPNTIVGAAPVGTPGGITTAPAGNDTIAGAGGDDTLVGGDTGAVDGGSGNDTLIGGRSTTGTTVVRGGEGDDTVVSGLGNDSVFGDGGANRLVYASVEQGGLTLVDRGSTGVAATLPDPGGPATRGGARGGAEQDTIDQGFQTLVGSNGDDALTGGAGNDTLVGVAPAGTAGVRPGPAGNDALSGGGGNDILLAAEGADRLLGGPGSDVFIAGAGDDVLDSRDDRLEAPSCGAGTDRLTADALDVAGPDCEVVDQPPRAVAPGGGAPPTQGTPADTARPRLTVSPRRISLLPRRRIALRISCANEAQGCRGTLTIATRDRVRVGRAKPRRYTLAKRSIRLTSSRSRQLRTALPSRVLRIVRRGGSVRLRATLVVRDAAGNRTTKRVLLRLRRR